MMNYLKKNYQGVNKSNSQIDELKLMFSIKELSELKNKINSINLYNIQSPQLVNDLLSEVSELSESCSELESEVSVYTNLNQFNPLISCNDNEKCEKY
jgi:hypothetical protein